jgi:peptidoglycan/LPS O-acetylase OafA/YrhL
MGLIRFLLAMAVVAAHSAPILGLTLVGGKIAVQSFFVISGFYISLILNEKYPAGTRGTLLFYGNRFLRIYPIYWAVLLLTAGAGTAVLLLFGWHSFVSNVSSLTKDFAADKLLFLIASNVGILGIDLSSFMRRIAGAPLACAARKWRNAPISARPGTRGLSRDVAGRLRPMCSSGSRGR